MASRGHEKDPNFRLPSLTQYDKKLSPVLIRKPTHGKAFYKWWRLLDSNQ